MKKILQKKPIWLLAGFVLVLFCITLVMALMTKSTPKVTNDFQLAEVKCIIHESLVKTDGSSDTTVTAVHTGISQKSDIKVENASNIDAYIRVRLVTYYVDQDNNVVGKNCTIPTFTPNNAYWIADATENTYYYKYPVSAGGFTEDLIASGSEMTLQTIDGTATDSYEHLYQVVDVVAEAVQATPNTAVSSVWSVTVSGDGTLSK